MASSVIRFIKGVNNTTSIGDGGDLNDLQGGDNCGFYNVQPGVSNGPTTGYSSLLVGSHQQIATTKEKIFYRHHSGSPATWSSWAEIPLHKIYLKTVSGTTSAGGVLTSGLSDSTYFILGCRRTDATGFALFVGNSNVKIFDSSLQPVGNTAVSYMVAYIKRSEAYSE